MGRTRHWSRGKPGERASLFASRNLRPARTGAGQRPRTGPRRAEPRDRDRSSRRAALSHWGKPFYTSIEDAVRSAVSREPDRLPLAIRLIDRLEYGHHATAVFARHARRSIFDD